MEYFELFLDFLKRKAQVLKSNFHLTVLKENNFNLSIDKVPLSEYFVVVKSDDPNENLKIKVYKTQNDHKWYDESYSEDAEFNSPEFGISEINSKIKKLIDEHENQLVKA